MNIVCHSDTDCPNEGFCDREEGEQEGRCEDSPNYEPPPTSKFDHKGPIWYR